MELGNTLSCISALKIPFSFPLRVVWQTVGYHPTLSCDRLTGGSIVGDMAPYQAFSIGGLGSVRGYGEGAVGSGRSCLVANSELTLPLVCGSIINSSPIM